MPKQGSRTICVEPKATVRLTCALEIAVLATGFNFLLSSLQISHFLKESLVESYTDDIREVSGHLNTLSTILKNDKSADLGIILYDKALQD